MVTLNVADLSPEQREIWQAEQAYWALVKHAMPKDDCARTRPDNRMAAHRTIAD